jgi:hypothetical protein
VRNRREVDHRKRFAPIGTEDAAMSNEFYKRCSTLARRTTIVWNTSEKGAIKMTTQTMPRVLSAGTISSDNVKNLQGESLGSIRDLMIDVDSGQVAYAVLDFGGFLGIGSKLFAVPWQALHLAPEEKCFRLDVQKERLEEAHGFDPDNWPDMADRTWQTEVHQRYGQEPYWERTPYYTG